jgi:hypothetical protein
MKNATAFVGACSAVTLVLSLACAHPDAAARPDGASVDAWIPLTANSGFMVTAGNSQVTGPGAVPSVRGYLMARRNGKWIRLDPEGAGRFVPTN